MIIRKEVQIIDTIIKQIKCDMCGVKILKKKSDTCTSSVLMCNIDQPKEDVILGILAGSKHERADFCHDCYKRILCFIREVGGKAPSYYHDDEELMMSSLLVDDEEIEDSGV